MPTGVYKHKKPNKETRLKMSIAVKKWQKGRVNEKSNSWKGNRVSYSGLHKWISRKLGKPSKCEHCGIIKIPKDKKRWFDWANISSKYLRDLSDWIRLCRLCHSRYDGGLIKINK